MHACSAWKGPYCIRVAIKSIELYLNIRVNINIIRIIRHNLKTLQIRTIEGSLVTFLFLKPKTYYFFYAKKTTCESCAAKIIYVLFWKRNLRRIKTENGSCIVQRKKFEEVKLDCCRNQGIKIKNTRFAEYQKDLKGCELSSSSPSSSCRPAAAAGRGLLAAVRRHSLSTAASSGSPGASSASSAAASSRGSASGAPVRLETAPVVLPSWN